VLWHAHRFRKKPAEVSGDLNAHRPAFEVIEGGPDLEISPITRAKGSDTALALAG